MLVSLVNVRRRKTKGHCRPPVTDGAIAFCDQFTFASFVSDGHISESDFIDVTTKDKL
jgi:hypothetical protein